MAGRWGVIAVQDNDGQYRVWQVGPLHATKEDAELYSATLLASVEEYEAQRPEEANTTEWVRWYIDAVHWAGGKEGKTFWDYREVAEEPPRWLEAYARWCDAHPFAETGDPDALVIVALNAGAL